MTPKVSALAVFAAAWCAISYNAPTAEGMQSFAAFDWGKLIGAVVPAVIALFTGGGGSVWDVLRVVLAQIGLHFDPKPEPDPVPTPTPDDRRPLDIVRDLLRDAVTRLLDFRGAEAEDLHDKAYGLYREVCGCCEAHRPPVEARKP